MIKFSKFLKEYIRYIKKSNIWIMLILSVVMVLISIITPALVAKIITDMMKQEYKGVVLVLILLAIVQVGKLIINIFNSKLFFMIRKDLVLNIKKDYHLIF